jgi:capsular exopolysaccharide synthesis family protein
MELKDYLEIVRARRKIIIQITFAILILTLLLSALKKPVYLATAVIEYKGPESALRFLGEQYLPMISSQPERSVATQMKLISSWPVMSKVSKELNLKLSPQQLRKKLIVTNQEKNNLIYVSITDSNPLTAQKIANKVAKVYLAMAKKTASSEIRRAKQEVSYKIKDIQEDIHALQSRRNSSASKSALEAELSVANSIYTNLEEKYQQLNVLEDLTGSGSTLAAKAQLPQKPTSPNIPVNTFLALLVGLTVGVIAAFSQEYFDNSLKSADDINKHLELPVLGQIPATEVSSNDSSASLVEPRSLAAEAYRTLRTNLEFCNYDRQSRSIIVTSPSPSEGKTTVAANLASIIATARKKVILLDCDFRNPHLHKVFGLDNFIGLSTLLSGKNQLAEIVKSSKVEGLSVVTSGPTPPNPSELLGSKQMRSLLAVLREQADFVIIDTPPVCLVTDPVVLASATDGVLVVTAHNSTTREAARFCKSTLDKVSARILGVVLNKLNPETERGYYSSYAYYNRYYHHYGYGYGYGGKKASSESS